jgi:Holliday junction DNA helicase RuvB
MVVSGKMRYVVLCDLLIINMVVHSSNSSEAEPETPRAVSPTVDVDTSEVNEAPLRPKTLDDYVGQFEIKRNLSIFMQAAQNREESMEHVLFHGPPGLGKTTLSHVVSHEMGANLRITSGPALERQGDVAAIITNLEAGDVLFIDEIHRLKAPVEEMLYSAMEDFAIDIILGKGPSARSMRLNLPRFTLVGATTKMSLISSPLRDRFGHVFRLEFYNSEEIQAILRRSAGILGIEIESSAARRLAASARQTPRIANRLLRRVRDFASVQGQDVITIALVEKALDHMSIDSEGLDHMDRSLLQVMVEKFSGGPVGLSTLAAATHEESQTLEDIYEPFLIQKGFMDRTPRGRIVTKNGYRHLGLECPASPSFL